MTTPAGWYDDGTGKQRYWDGNQWTIHAPAAQVVTVMPVTNGQATTALVLAISGFVLTGIPLFIGLILGIPLHIIAIIFAITGLNRAAETGLGKGKCIAALILSTISIISMFFGAGTIW